PEGRGDIWDGLTGTAGLQALNQLQHV
ncbi:ribosome modulation factor, partial [Pseudomonas aeruginosa]